MQKYISIGTTSLIKNSTTHKSILLVNGIFYDTQLKRNVE
jgi:hypothetical protein